MQLPIPLPRRLSPSLNQAEQCTHCGYCLPQCPTYRVENNESQSPRGRISIILALQAGYLEPQQASELLSHCLLCRACHSACPVGVRPGKLVGLARSLIPMTATPWWVDLFHIVTNSDRLTNLLARGLTWYVRYGQQRMRRHRLLRWWPTLARLEALIPDWRGPDPIGKSYSPAAAHKGRVALLGGCMARLFLPQIGLFARELLQRTGFDVVVLAGFGCCGAPFREHGDRPAFLRQARRLLDSFAVLGEVDHIVCDSSICVTTGRSYGRAMEKEERYATLAQQFSSKVADFSEFMAGQTDHGPWQGQNPGLGRLTWHDHCQILHGYGLSQPGRQLLRSLATPLHELPRSDRCCGAGGDYMLRFPQRSDAVRSDKLQAIADSGADTVVGLNPGCLMNLTAGLRQQGSPIRVRHLVEVLGCAARQQQDGEAGFNSVN
ncbi:MAG: (Fe-S)-binding protein [Magnetococcales bacterium]|nr:(Fe-S)-binding protein [Magnetococcales bacterium]